MSTTEQPKEGSKRVTLSIPDKIDQKVDAAVGETGLSRAAVIRLSLDRGIDRLLEQLKGSDAKTAA
ncbi:ribbon-helix-helix protein, CopG family [Luteolibacter luteus]|uniref:Ribbon-helix-helix protein, CopG family n=1 Tax=Luteolibacter luteus TaxID=2728835 RepID=A0A858RET7_9BACT|nr:ribbon-helix-helix protein, CopG family [Luteolibacter luteus]QJE95245.1 ribbon-helix-helix protein, CopG family [Luteolibacter luteus]